MNISILVLFDVQQYGMQIPAFRLLRIAEDLLTLKMAAVCSSEMLEACLLDGAVFRSRILLFVVLISAS